MGFGNNATFGFSGSGSGGGSGSANALAYFVAAGTNTYTGTISTVTYTSYTTGDAIQILFTNANTAASTLNINSIGAKSIVKNGNVALDPGDIIAGEVYLLSYDGVNFQMVSIKAPATVPQLNTGTDNSAMATSVSLNTSKYGTSTSLYLFNNFT